MDTSRRPRSRARLALLAPLVAAPFAALAASAVVDMGPGSKARASLFPAALALFGPATWDAVAHSGAIALVVALGSRLLGVPLARAAVRRWFWGRAPLASLAFSVAAVPPLVTALGMRRLLGPGAFLDPAEQLGPLPAHGPPGATWLALLGVGLIRGVPLVALAAARALEAIDPAWEDSARSVGASPRGIARAVARPLIRPAVLRAVAAVFGLTLLDPGAPLALGLRRTIGWSLVEAAGGAEPATASVLAVLASALAAAPFALAWRLGPPDATRPRWRRERASWRQIPIALGALVAWSGCAWLPVATLAAEAAAGGSVPSSAGPTDLARQLGVSFTDPIARAALADSAALGAVVATAGLILAMGLGRPRPAAGPPAVPWAALVLAVPAAVGLGRLPALLGAAAASGSLPELARVLRGLARAIDPLATPGVAAGLALIWAWTPRLARSWSAARARWRPEYADAATVLGGSGRWARFRLAAPLVGPPVLAAWLFVAAAAACDAGASLLLCPTGTFRPITPTLIVLQDTPGAAQLGATLALIAALLPAAAFAVSSSAGRPGADRQGG